MWVVHAPALRHTPFVLRSGFTMRSTALTVILLASLSMTGCSRMGADVLTLSPSPEKTSAISPVPAADVGMASQPQAAPQPERQAAADSHPEELAWAAGPKETAAFSAQQTVAMPAQKPMQQMAALNMPIDKAPRLGTRSRIYPHQFGDAHPINFGSASPRNHAVHGVDVSRWQGDIDWERLRTRGANFAYIKATDGGDHLDPMFRTNWRKAKEAGLKRGAYHFFYWCRTGREQAEWFIRNVPRDPEALPPVIDVEWNGESRCRKRPSPETVREKMQTFMDMLERHYGKRPVIYTAPDFYKDNLRGAFQDYPFWLRSVAAHPSKVYPGRKWIFWQYSGSGLSHGVKGRIDLNVFHGTEKQWHRWVATGGGYT